MDKDDQHEGTMGKRKDFPIITREAYFRIKIESIETIEQRGSKLHVMTDDREEYIFKGRIEDVVDMIAGYSFYRVMKKLVVNFDRVTRMGDGAVTFESGLVYGVGRNNYIKMRRAYKNFLLGYPPFAFHRSTDIKVSEDNLLSPYSEGKEE